MVDGGGLSIYISPSEVVGGGLPHPSGTVTLSSPAPAGGVEVRLVSNQPRLAMPDPALVVVPAGETSAFFQVGVASVDDKQEVSIVALLGDMRRWAHLTLRPAANGNGVAPQDPAPTGEHQTEAPAQPPTPEHEPEAEPPPTEPTAEAPAPNAQPTTTEHQPEAQPQPAAAQARSRGQDIDALARANAEQALALRRASLEWLPRPRGTFASVVMAILPALPFIAAAASVAIYVAPYDRGPSQFILLLKANPILGGLIIAVLIGITFGSLYDMITHGTSADGASPHAYLALCSRLATIDVRLHNARESSAASAESANAWEEASALWRLILINLQHAGIQWMMGTGYATVWKLVHQAESRLVYILPEEDVIGTALMDELRLIGSQVDNAPQLLAKLRTAVAQVQRNAVPFLTQPPAAGWDAVPVEPAAAREALADVHQAIHDYRDRAWDALIRLRTQLVATLGATGLATYLLVGLALTGHGQIATAPTDPMSDPFVAAATLYVVGALIGLFNRLSNESGTDTSVEDYGLSIVRLCLTPVISGLAAIGGVALLAMVPSIFSGTSPLTPHPVPPLTDIFNLSQNGFALVYAAIFGLSPNLFIGTLQTTAEQYKSALKSTSAQSGAGAPH